MFFPLVLRFASSGQSRRRCPDLPHTQQARFITLNPTSSLTLELKLSLMGAWKQGLCRRWDLGCILFTGKSRSNSCKSRVRIAKFARLAQARSVKISLRWVTKDFSHAHMNSAHRFLHAVRLQSCVSRSIEMHPCWLSAFLTPFHFITSQRLVVIHSPCKRLQAENVHI